MNEVRVTSIFDVFEIIFFSSKVVTKRKMVHRLTKELFSREASVDKCIKCSRKFCNILWKTWLTKSLRVNVLELQPNTLFKKGLLSQIISKVAVRKCSLTWLFVWNIFQISGKPSVVECFGYLKFKKLFSPTDAFLRIFSNFSIQLF